MAGTTAARPRPCRHGPRWYARDDNGELVREGRGWRRPVGVRRALPQQQGPDHGAIHGVVRDREEVLQADPHQQHADRALRGGPGRRRVRLPPRLQRTTSSTRPRPSGTRSGSTPTSAWFPSPGPTPNRMRMAVVARQRQARMCVPRVRAPGI
jgi:hypothetical protein